MNIRIYGTDERLGFCRDCLLKKNIRSVRNIILLPIPSTRDGKTLSGTQKTPWELFVPHKNEESFSASGEEVKEQSAACEIIHPGDAFVGYGIPKDFREYFASLGAYTVDVSLDEKFTEENAALTADGTLGKILTYETMAPKDLSIGIIGYGRIGKRLANLLLFLGSEITVFTTRKELVNELCSLGVSAVFTETLKSADGRKKLSELDLIINTAPARLIDGEALDSLGNTKIIELASGDNFPDGKEILRLPSLPSKMYPKSAGKVLADSVLRMLGENN